MAIQMKTAAHAAISFFVLFFTALAIYYQFNVGLWRDQFYYNGDNITLALVVKSLVEGEPFRWVFSSQTFLFPEGPLFAFSYMVTRGYKAALITNAYLNIGLILLSVFLITAQLNFEAHKRFYTLTTLLSLVLLVLCLEAKPDVNSLTVFTPILFETYYSGVIIISLFQIFLFGRILKSKTQDSIFSTSAFIAIGALTYASDPLYLLQFLAPILLISLTFIVNREFRKPGIKILICALATYLLGLVIRYATSSYAVATVGSYINLQNISTAASNFYTVVSGAGSDNSYAALWLLWLALWIFQCARFIILIQERFVAPKSLALIFTQLFFVLAPPVTLVGVIVSGNYLTRYMLPVPLYTLIGCALLFVEVLPKRAAITLIAGSFLFSLLFFCFQYVSHERTYTLNESDSNCFNLYAVKYNLHPVGGYWTSRYLTLYAPKDAHVWQVHNNFSPYNWLSNVHDHQNSSINSVIVDHSSEPSHITISDVEILGEPDSIYQCSEFDIFYYNNRNPGNTILNERIRSK